MANGVFLAWYPVKDRAIGDTLATAAVAGGFPKALQAEFLAYPRDDFSLAGGGVLVCNAPWRLDEKLAALGGSSWAVWATAPRPGAWTG